MSLKLHLFLPHNRVFTVERTEFISWASWIWKSGKGAVGKVKKDKGTFKHS